MLVGKDGVEGVRLEDGSVIRSNIVLSNATPKVTFIDLLPSGVLPESYLSKVKSVDYTSPVTKINGVLGFFFHFFFNATEIIYSSFGTIYAVALSKLPNFLADPHTENGQAAPHHRCTIHLNCEESHMIETAFQQGRAGLIPDR